MSGPFPQKTKGPEQVKAGTNSRLVFIYALPASHPPAMIRPSVPA